MIRLEVFGDYACFSRPELKTERVSYDVMTPSAARGIVEAVFWHPGLEYKIDRIYVMNPIRTTSIKRNEVKSKILAGNVRKTMIDGKGDLYLNTSDERNQRSSLVLQDVRYVIEAHFDMTSKAAPSDNPGKFQDILKRRIRKGQCYHQPYFGCREFPAHFRAWEGQVIRPIPVDKDLGYMLYDMNYEDLDNIQPMFFHAQLNQGVMEVENCEVIM
ncbi:MAG: type I-C CRISPR-associated protein Cas5c [Lachnospiraceae bacterium]|nr:type I-C CRISPR-associated protein Cas5c [Lachnospiraceae bacterium]